MLNKKNKIIITGAPRSGTTILANYINSMNNGFCFIEPHWQHTRHHNKKFLKDEKLKKFWFLKYNQKKELPLDIAINKILKKYNIVGFKETYRCNQISKIAPEIPNEDLIKNYIQNEYELITVIRHPLKIWNSNIHSDTKRETWGGNIELFLKNLESLYELSRGEILFLLKNF